LHRTALDAVQVSNLRVDDKIASLGFDTPLRGYSTIARNDIN
jgi:hypothetical protein